MIEKCKKTILPKKKRLSKKTLKLSSAENISLILYIDIHHPSRFFFQIRSLFVELLKIH